MSLGTILSHQTQEKPYSGPVIMKNVTFGYSIQWFSQLFISEKARFIIMPNRGFSNHVRKKGSPWNCGLAVNVNIVTVILGYIIQ